MTDLLELNYNDFKDKQTSIVKLFPSFYDRVKKVASNGGAKLVGTGENIWTFKVSSGTDKNKFYYVRVQFTNIPEIINKSIDDPNIWTKKRDHLNLNALAKYVLYNAELKTSSTDPSSKWWGFDSLRTAQGSELDHPNTIQPNDRNPDKVGIMSKHQNLVFNVLPFYLGTMANHLKKYYKDVIIKAEQDGIKKQFHPEDKTLPPKKDLKKTKSQGEDNEEDFESGAAR